jgi:hypothetical protein
LELFLHLLVQTWQWKTMHHVRKGPGTGM